MTQAAVPADQLLGLLAAPERLRSLAALVLGARTTAEVGDRAGLDPRTAVKALSRLEQGGLVVASDGGWTLLSERFTEAAREARPTAELPPEGPERVLHAFLRDGHLTSIPSKHSSLLVVLDHVVRVFEPGRRYPEREVDAMLRAFHPDHAALRRYLVDEAFLSREASVYWRSGGAVEV